MPFLLAGSIVAIGIYFVLNWWANASTAEAKKTIHGLILIVLVVLGGLLVLGLLRGNLGFLPVLVLGLPLFWRHFKAQRGAGQAGGSTFAGGNGAGRRPAQGSMTRSEAFQVLGLSEGATKDEIKKAYKDLMAKAHPDKGGNDWMAAKINEAKRLLLDE